jgi:hypothetical protein
MSSLPTVKVAAAHAAPVFLDRRATAEKAVSLIREAAGHGAELIVFPESCIPAFPVWTALWAPILNHDLFEAMVEHSVDVPGPEVVAIANEARRLGVFVSIGISERGAVSAGCIWNSNLLIGDRGELLVHHRTPMPTFYEKLVWAHGDGAGLRVASTRLDPPRPDRRPDLRREHQSARALRADGTGRALAHLELAAAVAHAAAPQRGELRQRRGEPPARRRARLRGQGVRRGLRRVHGPAHARTSWSTATRPSRGSSTRRRARCRCSSIRPVRRSASGARTGRASSTRRST